MPSRAQIVVTIGPATQSPSVIDELLVHQMDAVRLNFSWGTHEEHASYIKTIREATRKIGRIIPIIQDLSGPRVQDIGGHHRDAAIQEIITPKDLADLAFGLDHGVDYICLSYVGRAADIQKLAKEIADRGGKAKIIAKVERQAALDNLDEIIEASDAIMLGRGDLGLEIPIEKIPFVEADVIKKCKAAGKPVIVATQMLVSMVENPEPSRAEVTDIAYAIQLGADAVMLSEETARGKYPVKAVEIMERVIVEAEKYSGTIHPLS